MSQPKKSFLLRFTPNSIHPLVPALAVFVLVNALAALIFYIDGIYFVIDNFQGTLLFGTAFGYLLFINRLIHNVHVKDFHKLLDVSALDTNARQAWTDKMNDHRSQVVETFIAVMIGLLHSYLQGYGNLLTGESTYPVYDIYRVLLNVTIWVMITQSTSLFIRNMTMLNELSAEIRIDLLNLEKFMPLTRSGVWSILGFIGVYTIIFGQGVDSVNLADPAILVLAPTIFWMVRTPLKGFRKRVVKAKEAELKLIEAAIEGDREALKASRISANLDNINVIDLINYKKMIQGTFEIPVNIPTASRFVFYLIIPLLTWIAASMVDKVIDYLIK